MMRYNYKKERRRRMWRLQAWEGWDGVGIPDESLRNPDRNLIVSWDPTTIHFCTGETSPTLREGSCSRNSKNYISDVTFRRNVR